MHINVRFLMATIVFHQSLAKPLNSVIDIMIISEDVVRKKSDCNVAVAFSDDMIINS